MEQKYIYQVLPFLKELERDRREQLEAYFDSAPLWLMNAFQVLQLEKGTTLVHENAVVDMVYIIGKGTVKGTDYRIYGTTYDFMRFEGVYALGGMEIVMDLDKYQTTLITMTPCTMIAIPKRQFERWLKTDIKALKQEAKAIGEYLLMEGRNGRAFLFLQGSDRLCMLFADLYRNYAKQDAFELKSTRQELAEQSGLCVKTVNRSVKKFEDENLIGRKGNTITITKEQCEKMEQIVAELIDRSGSGCI
ncbi:Crp/Fnr family transcriptional regulator [Hespellia stercorisuis]|uniref:CRP/FNR family transcriptional regulator, cyclic AMP receptor protein n=1 Tax=Hespellia stercorisuis DSM 15480 TaxID=1121950 RepID=A0A1M6Q0V2_9FIRM|nr:Crp/Fnr family transcriptional regulator [Hespellia stercorisuis]SHK13802.1 CRP/FNR family transcriptional regulator, cyclic AMP receptor protein [Hespellia stercorisuis DSM 15480]